MIGRGDIECALDWLDPIEPLDEELRALVAALLAAICRRDRPGGRLAPLVAGRLLCASAMLAAGSESGPSCAPSVRRARRLALAIRTGLPQGARRDELLMALGALAESLAAGCDAAPAQEGER